MAHNGSQRGPSRLMIKEMVLENFKSYAGAQCIGPFDKCFSSVVGPNGSGKSNVIDALLFVFGKRAKQLRLNKVSELIHKSTYHQSIEMARVSVHFQEIADLDDEAYEVVSNSSFIISRTAHRSNKSEYYINDRKSSFTEVIDLLKGKGIDLDNNRFLILQGEVEQISMMKPKGLTEHETGLLEYLEDIVGTEKYISKLEESTKRLEELNEKRQSLVQRVKIAERERDGLEAEKTAAEAYLSKERECLGAQSVLAQISVHGCKRNVDKIESNIHELEEKLAHEKAKFAEYSVVLKESEKKFNDVSKEHEAIQKELDHATAEFKEYERKDIKYRGDLKYLKQKLKKVEEKMRMDSSTAGELEQEIVALQQVTPQLQEHASELEEQLKKAEEVLEGLQESFKDEKEAYNEQLQKIKSDLIPWGKQMDDVQAHINIAADEQDFLLKKYQNAKQRLANAQEDLRSAHETAATKKGEIKQMEDSVQTLRSQAERARQAEAVAQAKETRLNPLVRELHFNVEEKRDALNFQQKQRALRAVVKALLQARDRGEIEGIHGRLGDLGAIDAKYDIAASTACPSLDYIVVDTTSAAERCVQLLRQRQLGVATFLILERQQHLTAALQARVEPPEGVPRLFDLVKPHDEKFEAAFFYAMRDVVVAVDLEQACRIAYGQDKRWRRVVTLKGEMINESGTMSGGGKPRSGRMCIGQAAPKNVDTRAAAAELQGAERELIVNMQALQEARQQLSQAVADATQAERALAQLETAISMRRLDAEHALAMAANLKKILARLEQEVQIDAEDDARIKVLGREIAEEEKRLADLHKKSDGLAQKAAALEAQIEGVGGEKLRKQKALVANLKEDVSTSESGVARKEAQARIIQKQLGKLGKESGKSAEEKNKVAAQQEQAKKDLKGLEDAALKVLEAVKETQELMAAKEEELHAIRTEFEQKQREVWIIRQVEVDIDSKLEQQRGAFKTESHSLKQWTKKAEELAQIIAERDGDGPAPVAAEELEQYEEKDVHELEYKVTMLDDEMQRMNINLEAIEAYCKKDADYMERVKQLEAATAERDMVRREHEEVRKRRLEEFMAGFNSISLKLKEMYQMITMGGDAELELVDSLDPFSEGILFSVRPPKKSWKNIANLSGGEKTLSSLSLVFALHHYKPTPLYVMDEIDAALDFKNVSIVGHYIKERTKNAQFVIISLRNNMFELADRLVGIYKTDNATKSVTINPGEFTVGAAAECVKARVSAGMDQEQLAPVVASR